MTISLVLASQMCSVFSVISPILNVTMMCLWAIHGKLEKHWFQFLNCKLVLLVIILWSHSLTGEAEFTSQEDVIFLHFLAS